MYIEFISGNQVAGNQKVLKMKTLDQENICSKFLEPIKLYDDFNQEFGYEFLHHPEVRKELKDCILAACKYGDIAFRSAYDKEAFLYRLVREAYETCKLWEELYSDFDIKSNESKRELIRELSDVVGILGREYGINKEQEFIDDLKERLCSEFPRVSEEARRELRGE